MIDDYVSLVKRLLIKEDPRVLNLGLGCGLSGESGEAVDILKKAYLHGSDLDKQHLTEELGDTLFYLVAIGIANDITLDTILKSNIDKIMKRYPNGFNKEDSELKRDRQ